jgi:hypothetical protein
MIRKISLAVLSAAILVTGFIAFRNLNYWGRSVMIFKMNSNQPFTRGMGRGRGGFEGSEIQRRPDGSGERFKRPERPDLPDSVGGRHDAETDFRMLPDSLRNSTRTENFRREGGSFRGDNNYNRRDGNFHGGRQINLGTVGWFLAVFALFTLITIGTEKVIKLIRPSKLKKLLQPPKPEETVNQ